jgi:hypothetical protein
VARLAAAALALFFTVPGAGAKVIPTGLRVCGASGCVTVADAQVAQSVVADATKAAPTAPAPYVRVEVLPTTDDPLATKPFYYVPSAHVIFSLAGPVRADPAGKPPAQLGWFAPHAWAAYYARVRRVWSYVDVESTPPTPWSDGASDLWIGRHANLLRRDRTVIALPAALAAKIRAAQRLG